MRKLILTPILVLLATFLYGQEFKISVTATSNNTFYYQLVTGGPGHHFKPGLGTSVNCSFRNERKIYFGLGLGYQVSRVEYVPNMNTGDFEGQVDNLNIVYIKFSAKYSLKHDFYLSLNQLVSLQLNYKQGLITDKQDGLGLSFSFGKQIRLKENLLLDIEPELLIFNIIPFNPKDNLTLRLTSAGLNLGVVFGRTE